MTITFNLLFLLISLSTFSKADNNNACGIKQSDFVNLKATYDYDSVAQTRGKIGQKEISGIASSVAYPGNIWGVNDSGNGNTLYLYNMNDAGLAKIFIVNGIYNIDWEDLTIGKTKAGTTNLYIADIGDNLAKRKVYTVYKMIEPKTKALDGEIEKIDPEVERIEYMYEDGARDAESLAFDPVSEHLYVISKREDEVGIYLLPDEPSDTPHSITKIGQLPLTFVVAAEFSEDGQRFMVKTYDQIYLWQRAYADQDFCEMISQKPKRAPYTMIEPQGESVCFVQDGYATLSEERLSIKPRLYVYKAK